MIAIDGYINVHQSMEDLGTLIAQGNVGANPQDTGEEDVVAINYDLTNACLSAYYLIRTTWKMLRMPI